MHEGGAGVPVPVNGLLVELLDDDDDEAVLDEEELELEPVLLDEELELDEELVLEEELELEAVLLDEDDEPLITMVAEGLIIPK